jgi:beta-lactamase regulating signal transducer with metallopeptidase domain
MNSSLQWLASLAFERMLFCLAEGTALALMAWFVLRFFPGKSSHTRFVVWFSSLMAIAILPFFVISDWSGAVLKFFQGDVTGLVKGDAVTLPASVAVYALVIWAVFAFAGLVRVAAGLWQLRGLRTRCIEICAESVGRELEEEVANFKLQRSLELLVSGESNAPTAIGFFRPAIVLPQWLVEQGPSEDLKHVVLHELAHLRRRDDWTNLLQKILKAMLFFHPAVWWMERKMSLDREMACDDAVLAETGNARVYAQSLARIAERSFLRRQVALAQAAVGRVRQLSLRVARILDPQRPSATKVWKPAIPAVALLAVVCGFGFSWVPEMVSLQGPMTVDSRIASDVAANRHTITVPSSRKAQAWPAKLNLSTRSATLAGRNARRTHLLEQNRRPLFSADASHPTFHNPITTAAYKTGKRPADVHTERGYVLLISTRRIVSETASGWQIQIQETRWLVPATLVHKPESKKT